MKVVRSYQFDARSSSRSILCDSFFPEYYPGDPAPSVSLVFELGEPKSQALCPSRLRVNARLDFPSALVIDEVEYFFKTLKQMYEL